GPALFARGLANRFDRDTMVGHDGGDLREHTGAIGDPQAHVVAVRHEPGVDDGQHRVGGAARGPTAGDVPAGDVDDVPKHGRSGWGSAGAGAVEHEGPGGFGFYEHRVVRLGDGCERVIRWHQRGVNSHRDRAVDAFGDREELDDVAGGFRGCDVIGGDFPDPLGGNV